jgi:hypothetical protein
MANFFEKRATEYVRDNDVFLSLVTPEPLHTFLQKPAREERLYDRLTIIVGTPGSGKTTIATLLQFQYIDALRRNQNRNGYKELSLALMACQAIDDDGRPRVAGIRLPLEAEYRDFWQLRYSVPTRTRLVLALLQARAMLGWIRSVEQTNQYGPNQIRFVAKAGAEAAVGEIGGLSLDAVRRRASEVERAVYSIGAALVPPATEAEFPPAARVAYRPFDALEAIELDEPSGVLRLQPLVMLDDAHTLHAEQFGALRTELARRELSIARWVLTRLDVLTPPEALLGMNIDTGSEQPGLQSGRDITEIAMQKNDERSALRRAFRKMASDMANRYLRQMPEFAQRNLVQFADILETVPDTLSDGDLKKLEKAVKTAATQLGISDSRRKLLEAEVDRFMQSTMSPDKGPDIRLAMLRVLMHRHAKRVPQTSLFETEDLDPAKPVKADSGVAEAARVQLFHQFHRPLYFGFDTVCDASSDNAEQFLRLAASLVACAETKLLRNRNVMLDSRLQHRALVEQAKKILAMDFPYARDVRALTTAMAEECVRRTLEPNASLDGGASAIGMPQDQFREIGRTHPRLARVLQFAVAYNIVTLAQNYGQGGKTWCLLELGGCVLLSHGLTLKRGGFLEHSIESVSKMLPGEGL